MQRGLSDDQIRVIPVIHVSLRIWNNVKQRQQRSFLEIASAIEKLESEGTLFVSATAISEFGRHCLSVTSVLRSFNTVRRRRSLISLIAHTFSEDFHLLCRQHGRSSAPQGVQKVRGRNEQVSDQHLAQIHFAPPDVNAGCSTVRASLMLR